MRTALQKGVVLMSAQIGLALPVLGGAKPVCTDIRTTLYRNYGFSYFALFISQLTISCSASTA